MCWGFFKFILTVTFRWDVNFIFFSYKLKTNTSSVNSLWSKRTKNKNQSKDIFYSYTLYSANYKFFKFNLFDIFKWFSEPYKSMTSFINRTLQNSLKCSALRHNSVITKHKHFKNNGKLLTFTNIIRNYSELPFKIFPLYHCCSAHTPAHFSISLAPILFIWITHRMSNQASLQKAPSNQQKNLTADSREWSLSEILTLHS